MMFNKYRLAFVFFVLVWMALAIPPALWAQSPKSVVVLPFEVHSQTESRPLQDALFDQLTEELRKDRQIRIINAGAYRQIQTPVDRRKALEIGVALKADYVITGSVTHFGDTLSVDAQVINVAAAEGVSVPSVSGSRATGTRPLATQIKTHILARTGLAFPIARVDIEGNRRISPEAILQHVKSRPGTLLSESVVTEDIRNIFQMGFFLDVQASVTDEADGKVVTFNVQEKGLITEIRLVGNKKLSQSDILGAMSVKSRQSLNQMALKEDLAKIKALYDNKGYYNAEIRDRVEKDGEKDFIVILDISENDRLYIRSISFEGNEAFTDKQLRRQMDTSVRTIFGIITDTGILKPEQLRQDQQKLTAYYFNNGFIHAQIGEPRVSFDAKGIHIVVPAREGRRFKFGQVGISGDELEQPRTELVKLMKVKSDEHYNREAVMKDLEAIVGAAQDEGFAHADVNPRIDIREEEQLVDVDFHIAKGGPVIISRIDISGNTVTRDKVIRRQLSLVEGDLYSAKKIRASYARLNQLRYFEEVDLQTERTSENEMGLQLRVKEKNTGMFMIGAGYSAVDQAIIMAQVVQQNLFGRGQILSLKASLGSKTNQYELSFTEPALFDLALWSKADIWKYKKEYDSYSLDTRGGGLTLGYPIIERITGYVGYRLSVDDIMDVNWQTASQYIKDQAGQRTTSSLTLTMSRDTTDDNMFPSTGTKASVSIQQAGSLLGGNSHFTKYLGSLTFYYPLYKDFVFSARGRMGFLQNNDEDDSKIPIYERFVLGGISSLRGLRYVGPTNPGTSDVIGGTRMLNASMELVFPFIRDAGMKGVVFYDVGNAWDSGVYLSDLRQTAGVGLRWYSPIGPLRLEYGWVLDRGNLRDDAMGRWEFTIGMFM